jgi:maleylacetate reductase
MAEEGIAALARALPVIVEDSQNVEARADAQYGAWLCGTVLGSVGMALHHKLCHTLGGSFNLPHAQTHTIVLPHALAYNRRAAPEAMQHIARALGTGDAATGVYELAKRCGAPLGLKDIGMSAQDVAKAADIASSNPYWNPRPIERAPLLQLLQDAFDGVAPRRGE